MVLVGFVDRDSFPSNDSDVCTNLMYCNSWLNVTLEIEPIFKRTPKPSVHVKRLRNDNMEDQRALK